jgi:antirestriction protein
MNEAAPGPRGGEAAPRESSGERAQPTPPRIYVASLADYNAGRLHGSWIDAAQDLDSVQGAIDAMLKGSKEVIAEEFAIHDFDGFGPWKPDEYEQIETVIDVAHGIAQHGLAYAAWRVWTPTSEAAAFEQDYLGQWPSIEDYAEDLADDLGLKITVEPESFEAYVRLDVAAFAGDLAMDLHVAEAPEGGVWLFQYMT